MSAGVSAPIPERHLVFGFRGRQGRPFASGVGRRTAPLPALLMPMPPRLDGQTQVGRQRLDLRVASRAWRPLVQT